MYARVLRVANSSYYRRLRSIATIEGALLLCRVRHRRLESNHALVGHEECLAVVFQAWQMPDSLVTAAGYHHAPMDAPDAHGPGGT